MRRAPHEIDAWQRNCPQLVAEYVAGRVAVAARPAGSIYDASSNGPNAPWYEFYRAFLNMFNMLIVPMSMGNSTMPASPKVEQRA